MDDEISIWNLLFTVCIIYLNVINTIQWRQWRGATRYVESEVSGTHQPNEEKVDCQTGLLQEQWKSYLQRKVQINGPK